ncbi:MAG: hypothetical protein ACFE8B_06450 [Candidatus Hermodarchaeota archaeon]
MPEKAPNKEKKFRIIIYHGHLHKIPLGDNEEEFQRNKRVIIEDSAN